MHKSIRKQLDRNAFNDGKDAILVFRVQFFASDCQKLHQEITRYLVHFKKINFFSCYFKTIHFLLVSCSCLSIFSFLCLQRHIYHFINSFVLILGVFRSFSLKAFDVLSLHSFTRPLIHSSIHSLTHSFIHPFIVTRFIHSFCH